ncbi:MAG: ATP-binding protein [Kiritimatiellae bacterium]|nr:ATP-binding protein [Kiritimatiellia bacterium]
MNTKQETYSPLAERVKELECLYAIARLSSEQDLEFDGFLRQVAGLVPAAWRWSRQAGACIEFDNRRFSGGAATLDESCCQQSTLIINKVKRGRIVAGYPGVPPLADDASFLLQEEQRLLDEIARQVSYVLERIESQRAREGLQAQLRHADRLATIGRLASGLAHEINEPLGCVLGFVQLLLKEESSSPSAQKDLEKIQAAALQARDIIRKLMVFARHSPAEHGSFDLNKLIESSADLWLWRCEDGSIRVAFELDAHLPAVLGNEGQIRQVITNLVINAVQAMPGGGLLTLATARVEGGVTLSVRDTGMGMTRGIAAKIFDPFFTTKEVDQGMGLGLSVVHGIVSGHEGVISVESEMGQGTTMRVFIPHERLAAQSDVGDSGER